jgi:hypothetical protein
MRYAIHDGSVVLDICVVDPAELLPRDVMREVLDPRTGETTTETVTIPGWTPRDGLTAVASDTAGIGWHVKKGGMVPPPDTASDIEARRSAMKVSRMQARIALLQAGLLDDVEAAVAAGPRAMQIAWADASEFHRTSPTITALASALSLTDEAVDGLFAAATTITA